ncbi:MAG: hypothetical protein ACU0DW_00540 [Shimia sp.]
MIEVLMLTGIAMIGGVFVTPDDMDVHEADDAVSDEDMRLADQPGGTSALDIAQQLLAEAQAMDAPMAPLDAAPPGDLMAFDDFDPVQDAVEMTYPADAPATLDDVAVRYDAEAGGSILSLAGTETVFLRNVFPDELSSDNITLTAEG